MSNVALELMNVGKIWNLGSDKAQTTLVDISLTVEQGEFVVLLGPSGCGKSSLLYLIAGLEEYTSGTITAFGESVSEPSPSRSLIFQESSLFPWLTVGQNVEFGMFLRKDDKKTRKEAVIDALQRVGLSEAVNKLPKELSGGMRQRVAVARALTMRPKVLLMDEPFAALDVQTRAKMQDFLIEVWKDSHAAVLFVTHQVDEAIALADRVVVMTARPGRVKSIVNIDIPRPRDPFSEQGLLLRKQLTDLLSEEVDLAFAEQEALN